MSIVGRVLLELFLALMTAVSRVPDQFLPSCRAAPYHNVCLALLVMPIVARILLEMFLVLVTAASRVRVQFLLELFLVQETAVSRVRLFEPRFAIALNILAEHD